MYNLHNSNKYHLMIPVTYLIFILLLPLILFSAQVQITERILLLTCLEDMFLFISDMLEQKCCLGI